ncbi:hypothetical protein PZH37_20510, partial [[Eubacterium] siraeum]|nr:hypothetical protein [[Eubacterium] siraeum]
EKYYGIGGNGGNGGAAITDNTKVYLNGGTVTVIGGDGGKGGDAGYGTDHFTNEKYYGIGGNGGNGGAAITDNTKVYLNGGTVTVIGGDGGKGG